MCVCPWLATHIHTATQSFVHGVLGRGNIKHRTFLHSVLIELHCNVYNVCGCVSVELLLWFAFLRGCDHCLVTSDTTDDAESKVWSLCGRIPEPSTHMCMAEVSLNCRTWSGGVTAHVDSACAVSWHSVHVHAYPTLHWPICSYGHVLIICVLRNTLVNFY